MSEIIFIIGVIVILMVINNLSNEGHVKRNAENEGYDVFIATNYLGGHPIETEGIKLGALLINNNEVKFVKVHNGKTGDEVFSINMDEIIECSLESKESITATRIALLGLLAFGLKKGKKYVRIKFRHKLREADLLFHNSKKSQFNEKIVKKINKAKMIQMDI